MTEYRSFETPVQPNWEGLVANVLRQGTPDRVYHIELFHDAEFARALIERFGIGADLDPADPHYACRMQIAFQRFLGFDYVNTRLLDMGVAFRRHAVEDTAELARAGGRTYQDEHTGPISDWESFEKFPWPDPSAPAATREVEWYQDNLPDDMCLSLRGTGHFCEFLCWLMGYETLCYALYDQPDLVEAIAEKLLEIDRVAQARMLEFDRIKIVWPSDDMGYKTGLLFSAEHMRTYVLRGHKILADVAHQAGRPCILHSCGNLDEIIDDLTDVIGFDGKHSFEDTIEDIRELKHTYGRKMALLGGIDVDFLCRADPAAIRRRTRETLDVCLPGGGYCLGSGNSVTNYIPVDNYLAMLDEGRLYGR